MYDDDELFELYQLELSFELKLMFLLKYKCKYILNLTNYRTVVKTRGNSCTSSRTSTRIGI